jgi:hypothetical protein
MAAGVVVGAAGVVEVVAADAAGAVEGRATVGRGPRTNATRIERSIKLFTLGKIVDDHKPCSF